MSLSVSGPSNRGRPAPARSEATRLWAWSVPGPAVSGPSFQLHQPTEADANTCDKDKAGLAFRTHVQSACCGTSCIMHSCICW